MNFEKYTEKSRQIIEAAQALALRLSHQRFMPEHVLSALMEDKDRLADKLIRASGGNPAIVAGKNRGCTYIHAQSAGGRGGSALCDRRNGALV